MAKYKISLSSHRNPAGFVADMQKRYPSSDVEIQLVGNEAEITLSDALPPQEQINACTFLSDRAKEEMSV